MYVDHRSVIYIPKRGIQYRELSRALTQAAVQTSCANAWAARVAQYSSGADRREPGGARSQDRELVQSQ